LQVSFNDTNNSESSSMTSENSIMLEQQHKSLLRATTMLLNDILNLYLSTYQDKDPLWHQNFYNY
ncbi:13978_t:CDS:1, partial [Cetraspora pellucida]